MATEEPKYTVEKKTNEYEIRQYPNILVAETAIDAGFESAGNDAFRILADYIFGNNTVKKSIAMTAPVLQKESKNIAMTAPVSMSKGAGGYIVQFTMPAEYTMQTIPAPNDARVHLRMVPARRVAVHRYSGDWSEKNYTNHLGILTAALARDGMASTGEPVLARFDPPFMLWLFRRNEIWLDLAP
ncbi:MAG: heme-binding protein [Spirochaetes bacterium]|nr:heme-binding protein [Spirochaetota bacterium]